MEAKKIGASEKQTKYLMYLLTQKTRDVENEIERHIYWEPIREMESIWLQRIECLLNVQLELTEIRLKAEDGLSKRDASHFINAVWALDVRGKCR